VSDLPFLPYGRQSIDDDDIAAVCEALSSDWLTTGPAVEAFEAQLVQATGARHAVVCSSGTAALHLATLAAGLGPGDQAIVPSITFVATANAVRYVGADVVFADVDPASGLMGRNEYEDAAARSSRAPAAVLPVHLNGQACDMAQLSKLATAAGAVVIEDASHALGTAYRVGNQTYSIGACAHSDMCVFSFHPVKSVTMGEGGAITTNDDALAAALRDLRSHGITRDPARFRNTTLATNSHGETNPWYYEQHALGLNYRANDIQCALGASQLRKLDRFSERRSALAAYYDKRLADIAPTIMPVAKVPGCEPVLHLYALHIDWATAGVDRASLMTALRQKGIGTQVHYIPVHFQPYYQTLYGEQPLPGAESYYSDILSVPLHAAMTNDDVDRVVSALRDVVVAK